MKNNKRVLLGALATLSVALFASGCANHSNDTAAQISTAPAVVSSDKPGMAAPTGASPDAQANSTSNQAHIQTLIAMQKQRMASKQPGQ
jgi:hypothetical protein